MHSLSSLRLAALASSVLLAACGGTDPAPTPVEPEETRAHDSRVFTADATVTTFAAMATAAGDTIDVSTTSRWAGVLNGAAYRVEVPANWNGKLVMYAHGYAGTGAALAGVSQRLQCFPQAGTAPVEHMVVGQHPAAQPRRLQAAHIGRVHAVVRAFVGPGLATARDGGLQVHHAHPRLALRQLGQGVTPDVIGCHWRRNRAMATLCQIDVIARIVHPLLVQQRYAGVLLDLVNAATGHHVAGQAQGQRLHPLPGVSP